MNVFYLCNNYLSSQELIPCKRITSYFKGGSKNINHIDMVKIKQQRGKKGKQKSHEGTQ